MLENISSPEDIKKLNISELEKLCEEIRNVLIETTLSNGGHLASNLGAVELTVALHKCFDSPGDSIIFDVGHQAYTHKLITGRYKNFGSLRKENGISGFTRPDESEHDIFYSGHAGVAVSQASGIDCANIIKNNTGRCTVAVIGDGSLTNGMIYEALNAAGSINRRLIVVLNDNEMSISENVGALARHLAVVRAKPEYYRLKSGTERALNKIPVVGSSVSSHLFRLKTELKNIIYSSSFFEDMGFRYIGPADGHSIPNLCEVLEAAKKINKPVLVHINTVKGKGYIPAEKSPSEYHGVSPSGTQKSETSFSEVFGKELYRLAGCDNRICAVTAAMSLGTGMQKFADCFPERFFDAGIAEEHALTFCSGLSAGGMIPVYAVYSSFFQRCFDQLIHDGALQKRKLVIAVDRAGFVGSDGETHNGLFDVSMVGCVPGIKVYSPSYYDELKAVLNKAIFDDDGVSVIRYPRGCEKYRPDGFECSDTAFQVYGSSDSGCAVVTYGRMFSAVCEIKDKYNLAFDIVKLNRIVPTDEDLISLLCGYNRIFAAEESVRSGGIGERLAAGVLERGYNGKFRIKSVGDRFVAQASVSRQFEKCGLDIKTLLKDFSEFFI